MEYETVIGLEIHCELATASKLFCSCENKFGGSPNTRCCPVCSAHPGILPVLNKKAVEYTVMAGLALGCEIRRVSRFDRKNYFYPDLPKAFQTSQFDMPLCKDGAVPLPAENGGRTVRINRIHLEEDAGKLIHSEYGDGTMVDLNRCGVPLIEIVTEPDMRSPEEAVAFLETVKRRLKYAGVSECRMEEGNLRCDVNLSLMPKGASEYGVRTEMKNVNSFKAAYRAMLYEADRQKEVLSAGGRVLQETRRWDDAKNKSLTMRSKEDAHDYRYFPEPDLLPVTLTEEDIENLRARLPEPPESRVKRYAAFGLTEYDAGVLTSDKAVSDFYDACAAVYGNKKTLANWVLGDVLRMAKLSGGEDIAITVEPSAFVKLLRLYDGGAVSQNAAKIMLEKLFAEGGDPDAMVDALGLRQIGDEEELRRLAAKIVAENPRPAADYRAGNKKAIAFFVGQIMKQTKGKANPQRINELLTEELEKAGQT
jgi:aspartyl-tRNA(Asn)/glutamyl-tRNA(Gln) amidotransferase subunit B